MCRVPYAILCTVARYRRASCFSLVSSVKPHTTPFAFGSAIGDLSHHKIRSLNSKSNCEAVQSRKLFFNLYPNTCFHGSQEAHVYLQSKQQEKEISGLASSIPVSCSVAQRLKYLEIEKCTETEFV